MHTGKKKIQKDKGVETSEFEDTIAQGLTTNHLQEGLSSKTKVMLHQGFEGSLAVPWTRFSHAGAVCERATSRRGGVAWLVLLWRATADAARLDLAPCLLQAMVLDVEDNKESSGTAVHPRLRVVLVHIGKIAKLQVVRSSTVPLIWKETRFIFIACHGFRFFT